MVKTETRSYPSAPPPSSIQQHVFGLEYIQYYIVTNIITKTTQLLVSRILTSDPFSVNRNIFKLRVRVGLKR